MAEVGLSLAVTADDATVGFEGKPPREPQVAVCDQLVDVGAGVNPTLFAGEVADL
jgi:hypothetical protein